MATTANAPTSAPANVPANGAKVERRKPIVPNSVLGMTIFIATEVMFFAGLFSAFSVSRSGAPAGSWPPAWQPRLPFEETAINTCALLASGVVLFLGAKRWKTAPVLVKGPLLTSILLGAFFVCFQGVEWFLLIKQGLTMRSSTYGAFFYLIIGTHALHAMVACGALLWAYAKLNRGTLTHTQLRTVEVLWLFVVIVWPILYLRVYL